MAKKDKIRVRVVTGGKYEVYQFENGQTTLLDTLETDKRPSEIKLAKEYGVSKVIIVRQSATKTVYEMDRDEFLAHATIVEDSTEVTE